MELGALRWMTNETLAKSLTEEVEDGYDAAVKIEDAGLAIRLAKA